MNIHVILIDRLSVKPNYRYPITYLEITSKQDVAEVKNTDNVILKQKGFCGKHIVKKSSNRKIFLLKKITFKREIVLFKICTRKTSCTRG